MLQLDTKLDWDLPFQLGELDIDPPLFNSLGENQNIYPGMLVENRNCITQEAKHKADFITLFIDKMVMECLPKKILRKFRKRIDEELVRRANENLFD